MCSSMSFTLPLAATRFIGDARLSPDEVGESPCDVYRFTRGNDRYFLKISSAVLAPTTYSVLREAQVLQWLSGRLNVPEVVQAGANGGGAYMITRAVPGEPLTARVDAGRPVRGLFAEALRQLRAVPAADCPFQAGAAFRLRELEYLLANDLCDRNYDLEPWPDLSTPEDLLERLRATLPSEDPVFSHGDLGDSNVFVDAREQLHFIDMGRAGLADRWMDVAFIHRNLREEVSLSEAAAFLDALGEPDEPAKREFFEMLDELF